MSARKISAFYGFSDHAGKVKFSCGFPAACLSGMFPETHRKIKKPLPTPFSSGIGSGHRAVSKRCGTYILCKYFPFKHATTKKPTFPRGNFLPWGKHGLNVSGYESPSGHAEEAKFYFTKHKCPPFGGCFNYTLPCCLCQSFFI
ncbi:hypothetical protein [Desulforamulus ruminis]|uniref:hypothetical protein n=1 Tax=Desulforamulus ruminis TaxID=1564 RepID=UPI00117F6E32|nr:hypothetical protein [Desulforamulus ruminis]